MKPHSPRRRLLLLLPVGLALTLLASAGAYAACTAANANANLAERTPTADFTLHGDGTATHAKTGLMWKRCPEGAGELWNGSTCTSSALTYNWTDALLKAKNSTFAGYSDWRLPSIKEMQSIAETCGYNPALNTTVFPGPAPWGGDWTFWSATSLKGYPSGAWYVYVNYGFVSSTFGKSMMRSVRLVRGGQSFGSFDRRLDYTPDGGNFSSFNGVPLSTVYSDSKVLSGLTTPTGIKITNGEYRIGGGSYTTAPGVVSNGQTVQVRHTSSASYATTVTTTLTVGGVDSTLVSTTQSAPTAPSAPQNVVGTAGNGQISVAFDAPASPGTVAGGGAATISSYTADCGGLTNNGGSSPLLVTGLTNGTGYACTVTATNSAGLTATSAAAASVTPATVPDAPTGVSASAGNAQAAVSFSAPGSNGGAAIDNYRATCGSQNATGSASPLTVTGLSNGTPVTCTVAAHNSAGWSVESSASGSVTPSAPTAPGAPTAVVGTPGNAQISVAFVAPASPGTLAGGGAATITGYTATCGSQSNTGAASPIVVSGLSNGTATTCTATATNSVPLTSAASAASASVTPRTVPDAPASPAATPRPRAAAVSFTPGATGGASIDQYKAVCTSSDGGVTATSYGTASPFTAGLLTAGKTYTCVVAARNAAGWGSDSPASGSFTVPASALAILPDSGQTNCYDGSTLGTCTSANTGDAATYPRQDARYGRDAAAANGELAKTGGGEAGFDYTALDASGNATTASSGATPHPCVRDNLTGLVWEVKTDDGGLHDQDHTYTWYSSNAATNGGHAGTLGGATCGGTLVNCNTEAYAAAVNAVGWCGFNDWRLPSARELLSIVHFGRRNPAIDPVYFPNTPSTWPGNVFWSADSSRSAGPSYAWNVEVDHGITYYTLRPNTNRARLVRGGSF